MPKNKLLENLRTYFNDSEIRDLCYSLDIDYDNLNGDSKIDKTRELIDHCFRHGLDAVLIERCAELRPHVKWQTRRTVEFSEKDKDPYIFTFAKERSQMTGVYTNCAAASDNLEVITLTMQAILDNYGDQRLINWIAGGKKIRILVLSPASMSAKIRSKEEGVDIPKKAIEQFERLKSGVFDELNQRIALGENILGSLEVRLYDGHPYLAYFKADEQMIVGFYYSHIKGFQSESVYIGAESPVNRKMQDYFNYLWEGQKEDTLLDDRVICRISESHQKYINLDYFRETVGRVE